MNQVDKLIGVLNYLKSVFIGKDEIVDLLGVSLVAKENLFLLGPPGTAKSAIIRLFSKCIKNGKNFEYLLTRFTEPNEIFGPFDIRKLKDGELITNTEGMMPEASLVFLDEIFNANSAILNSLLMALNERVFRRGKETKKLPTLIFVGASNQLPEDESLNALLDRFLIRVKCDYVNPDLLNDVLTAGWNLENRSESEHPFITSEEVKELQLMSRSIDLSLIRTQYIDIIRSLRNTGIKLSDRRAVKLQNLIAASAFISKKKEASISDLWVLRYIWDTEEQLEILAGLINNVIEKDNSESHHPQAFSNKAPNAEELMSELNGLSNKWSEESISCEEQNIIKDKLRFLQSRCDWIKNHEQKQYLQNEVDKLWKQILQTI